jgi:heat shock protein HslJ
LRLEKALLWLCAVGMTACAAPTAPVSASAATLAGTRWMGVVDSSIDARMTPWLEFIGPGRVSGFSGCNLLNGAWRSEGGQVRIGPIAMTKRGCTGPANDLERRVLAALSEQSRITREGAKLVFVSPAGDRFEFLEAK